MEHKDIIIIGAGISGLLCASRLTGSGREVTILEKEQTIGGRTSTTIRNNIPYDHGAPFFTIRDLRFQIYVDDWLEKNICKTWFISERSDLGAQGHVRYCGKYKMSDPMEFLAAGLDIRNSTIVTQVSHKDSQWTITTKDSLEFTCKTLILTAPLPVSLALLEKGNSELDISIQDELKGIHYSKRITILSELDSHSGLPNKGGIYPKSNDLAWLSDNQTKGVAPQTPSITLHSSAQFAEDNWKKTDDTLISDLTEQIAPLLSGKITTSHIHKWQHAFPLNTWHDLFYHDTDTNLYLSGDAFGGPRVEGAALSGIQTADEILEKSIMEK